jgi:hypothetical protein
MSPLGQYFARLLSRDRATPRRTLATMAVMIREAREDDAAGIVRLSQENSAYHVQLAPEHFRLPDEEGLVEFIENDREWREGPDTLALVAEDDGVVAGYLEASLQRPDETARWQGSATSQRFVSSSTSWARPTPTSTRASRHSSYRRQRSGDGTGARSLPFATHSSIARCGPLLGAAHGLRAARDHLSETTRLAHPRIWRSAYDEISTVKTTTRLNVVPSICTP